MQHCENDNLILVSKRCNTKTTAGPGKNEIILPTGITKAGNDSSPVMKKIIKTADYKTNPALPALKNNLLRLLCCFEEKKPHTKQNTTYACFSKIVIWMFLSSVP